MKCTNIFGILDIQQPNPLDAHLARFWRLFLLILIVLCMVATVGILTTARRIEATVVVPPIFVCVIASLCYVLSRWQRPQLSLVVMIFTIWIVFMATSFARVGIYSLAYVNSLVLIMLSGAMLHTRISYSLTATTIALGAVMVHFHGTGALTQPVEIWIEPVGYWLAMLVCFVCVTLLTTTMRRIIITTIERLQQSELALEQRNQQLEAEAAQRQRLLDKINKDSERYRSIVEDNGEYYTRWTPDGTLQFVNDAYCRFRGKPREALIGTNFITVSEGKSQRRIREKLTEFTPQNPVITDRYEGLNADGEMIWQEWTDRGIFDDEGKLVEVLTVGRDITAQMRLIAKEQELDNVQQRQEFLTDFLNGISHDLKTPLSVVQTSLYLLRKSRTDEQRERRIDIIEEQTRLLTKMIEDIIAVSRLNHVPQLELLPLELRPLLDEVTDGLLTKIEAKAQTLDVQHAPQLPLIEADSAELKRALLNLVENAINYTPDGGRVSVSTEWRDDTIHCIIEDSGIGIKPADLPHIFERFYRATNARDIKGGTGLGLAIVKKVLDLHGAQVQVSSEVGKGTRFTIILQPIAQVALHP